MRRSCMKDHMKEEAERHCEYLLLENEALNEALNRAQSKLKDSYRDAKVHRDKAVDLEGRLAESEASLLLHNTIRDTDASLGRLRDGSSGSGGGLSSFSSFPGRARGVTVSPAFPLLENSLSALEQQQQIPPQKKFRTKVWQRGG